MKRLSAIGGLIALGALPAYAHHEASTGTQGHFVALSLAGVFAVLMIGFLAMLVRQSRANS